MKTPSVSLLLGVCVLLLSALTVSAVLVYVPPYPPVRLLVHLAVFLPYVVSTVVMVSIKSRLHAGRPLIVSMETALLGEETQEFGEDYNDIAADVTTEHEF